jgi:Flp pilus assembly protein TadG
MDSTGSGSTHTSLRRRRSQEGAVAVEFALIAPVLFLLLFGIIDFGFGFQAWDASASAAREGARVGIVDPNVADIVARVRDASSFLDQSKLNVSVTCSRSGAPFGACPPSDSWVEGDLVRVTVTYDYGYITPLPHLVGLGDTFHVTAQTEGRFEGV